ncbi:tRNA pseudouridine(65) synthase TruC [Hydrogenimonas sp.]
MAQSLDILYQDDWLVAINKPGGLLVHRSMIDKSETRFAMQMVRDMLGRRVYPIHRLDKPTSGVLLFVLDADTARRIGTLFHDKAVEKRYIAVVRGYIDEEGVIDYPLKEAFDKTTDAKARRDKPPQAAVTRFTRLATVELPIPVSRYPAARYSLVRLQPQTGRRHQLRRHMKHIFHPIVGDTKYGRTEHNNLFRRHFGIHRLLLHAESLELPHPVTGERLRIVAGYDEAFARAVALFYR